MTIGRDRIRDTAGASGRPVGGVERVRTPRSRRRLPSRCTDRRWRGCPTARRCSGASRSSSGRGPPVGAGSSLDRRADDRPPGPRPGQPPRGRPLRRQLARCRAASDRPGRPSAGSCRPASRSPATSSRSPMARRRAVEVRRRFEIADGIIGWGFLPFAAIGHRADETIDWRGPYPRQAPGRYVAGRPGRRCSRCCPASWGAAQTGVADFVPTPHDDATYWLHAIPLGDARAGRAAGRAARAAAGRARTSSSPALTLFDGTADPLVLEPRRQLLVEGAGGELPEVDLGIAIRVAARCRAGRPIGRRPWPDRLGIARRRDPDGSRPRAGDDRVARRSSTSRSRPTRGSRSAAGRSRSPTSTRGATQPGRPGSRSGRCRAADVRVDVRLSVDGEPTPARVRFVAADGRYLPPLGHREEINPGLFEDTGAGLILGGDTYAYVPGAFQIDLPLGRGRRSRSSRGSITARCVARWSSSRAPVTLDDRARATDRPAGRTAGGRPTPTSTSWPRRRRCSRRPPRTSMFVHLLATQLGDEFTNVTGPGLGLAGRIPSGRHFVIVGTENRQNVLGHLGAARSAPPGRAARLGRRARGPDRRRRSPSCSADWADRCHAEGGLVVGAHFPLPLAEIAADIVAGRIDAVEMQTFAPGLDNPSILEWYRFLNCGYRLPVLGGTDKMSAEMPVGAIRTYARLDPDAAPTFAAWSAAVRAGRTFATSGPVIELSVDGHEPGDVLALPASRRPARGAGPGPRGAADHRCRRARRERSRRRPAGRVAGRRDDLELAGRRSTSRPGPGSRPGRAATTRSSRPTTRAWPPTRRRCTWRSSTGRCSSPTTPRRSSRSSTAPYDGWRRWPRSRDPASAARMVGADRGERSRPSAGGSVAPHGRIA